MFSTEFEASIDKSDNDALRNAVRLLEHASLAARLANMISKPIELLGRALPAGASQAIATATTKSIEAALKFAPLLFCSPEAWTQQPLPMDRGGEGGPVLDGG